MSRRRARSFVAPGRCGLGSVEGLEGRFLLSAGVVADINTTGLGIGPSPVVQVGSLGFFAANDGIQSRALWVTDGTAAGTHPLKDVNVVVPVGEDPTATPPAFVDVNGIAYFAADDGVHGAELWKSDGTAAGTSLVTDLTPGTGGSSVSNLASFGGKVVFDASGAAGMGLYSSDGTAAGTQFLKPFAVVPGAGQGITTPMTLYNGALYFLGGPNPRQFQLWKTDGTAAGTVMVDDINGTGVLLAGYGPNMAVMNGSLYFAAETGSSFYQNIWVSDGTSAGTRQITHYSGSQFVFINYLTVANGSLYFLYSPQFSAFSSGSAVKSDGTEAGTQFVPLPVDPSNHEPIVAFGPLVAVGSSVYFPAGEIIQNIHSAVIENQELWKTDGTAAGTGQVADINPGAVASSAPQSLYNLGGTLYFTADDGTHGREVWKTDGTSAGTQLVKDINPGAAGSAPATYPYSFNATLPVPFASLNGKLLFAASRSSDGAQLWTSDGTADGTLPLTGQPITADSAPQSIVTGGGRAFFAADDAVHGGELWTSDGTTAGTRLLADVNVGAGSSSPHDLFYANGKLYFIARDGQAQQELYVSDGTTGAVMLTDPLALPPGSDESDFRLMGNVNGTVLFRLNSALWKTDGTRQGTSQVMAFSAMDRFGETAVVASVLYFAADDGTHGMELWKTNGTAAGTAMVKDINPSGSSSPFGLINVNGTLFFAATDGTTPALWKSDGTAARTVAVAAFASGLATPEFGDKVLQRAVVNGVLYFAAGPSDTQLWRTDGTAAGTVQVTQFPLPSDPVHSSGIFNMAALGNHLYFGADDGTHGMELWKTDGTAAGTVMVADIMPGAAPSAPQSLTVFNGALYFTALRPGGGRTLWVTTDGTSVSEVAGIAEAPFDPNVQQLAVGPTGVFFSAADPRYGQELWQLGGDVRGSVFNDGNDNGVRDAAETGLAGWTVYIDANNNGVLDPNEVSATTDSAGNYDFTGVGPGTIHIGEVLPAGWRRTSPLSADPTASMSPNIALIQGSVAGPVFGDVPVGAVNMDFNYLLTLAQHYGQPGTFASGDLTGDGQVNFDDLLLLAQNYGHSLPASAAPSDAAAPTNALDLLTRRRKASTRQVAVRAMG